jgi:hypothetical protein
MRYLGVLAIVAACLVVPSQSVAQTQDRFQVGAQFSMLRLSGVDVTDSGLGGWAAWDVTNAFAVEAAAEFFPAGQGDVARGGRKFQALGGPRVAWRTSRIGIFARTRAGVARVGEGRAAGGACIAIFPPPESCYAADTRLAIDVGGGVELYPSARTSIRLDIGSVMTRLGDTSVRFAADDGFARDLHVTAGVGVRF